MDIDAKLVDTILERIAQMSTQDILDDLNMLLPEEVAKKLRIGKSTVYNLVNQGKLPGTKVGGATRFRPRALYAFFLLKEAVSAPAVAA